ncbi:type II toxin-antitoxin system VapC family toxin [Wielerella bovis]|uniref:type II toxin-antitoxin system VapC family toxin n=1 Tax=Wielerella bovis TaxID=2917790 RepID=UPI0020197ED2|nr:type II toxin-antitoxin system VapC family toxin [Wielerella bovis]MCG7657761.1 type II toxin-antitoxin system VapC family toxin [Wielerella bovis]MCG7659982.1 type II toxin-antitoxin system VapC family toxin [Wielerella bovis]
MATRTDILMLVDTDVLIWLARGHENAKSSLLNQNKKYISAVTYMEMLQGMRNKAEMNAFLQFLPQYQFEILPLNEKMGEIASELVKNYALSHNMKMADALIASCAIVYNQPLLSANYKHYQFIHHLNLIKFTV